MRIEQVFETSRSDMNEAEQHAKLFQALRSTANTGSVKCCNFIYVIAHVICINAVYAIAHIICTNDVYISSRLILFLLSM